MNPETPRAASSVIGFGASASNGNVRPRRMPNIRTDARVPNLPVAAAAIGKEISAPTEKAGSTAPSSVRESSSCPAMPGMRAIQIPQVRPLVANRSASTRWGGSGREMRIGMARCSWIQVRTSGSE